MSRKFIIDQSNKTLYEFTVRLMKRDEEYKVTKTYPEFVELESYIIDIINHYSSRRASQKKFPLLSKNQWNGMQNSEKMLLKRIDELEKFLRNLVSRQEFWTPIVFDFFKIPEDYRLFLFQTQNNISMKQKSEKRVQRNTSITNKVAQADN